MIGYTMIGTNDLAKARKFYGELFKILGAEVIMTNERQTAWADESRKGMVSVCIPYDEKTATAGNGTMIALNVKTKDNVHAIHEKALSLGGTNEGDPGPRGNQGGFYIGYFRDLDGNKLAAFCFGG